MLRKCHDLSRHDSYFIFVPLQRQIAVSLQLYDVAAHWACMTSLYIIPTLKVAKLQPGPTILINYKLYYDTPPEAELG